MCPYVNKFIGPYKLFIKNETRLVNDIVSAYIFACNKADLGHYVCMKLILKFEDEFDNQSEFGG